MAKLYQRPVISTVFDCIGGATFIAGMFAFIAAYVDTSNGHTGAPGAIAGAVCIIMAAVYIGIGQVIGFLARASHRSEEIGALLREEILPQLKGMEERLGSAPASAHPPAPASPSPSAFLTPPALVSMPAPVVVPDLPSIEAPSAPDPARAPPSPEYFYSKDGREEGPFSATELKTFRAKGVIKDTTPVFRTGEKDWLPLRQFPDLARSR